MLLAGAAQLVDLDGPLWLAHDRGSPLRFAAGWVYPPDATLWGARGIALPRLNFNTEFLELIDLICGFVFSRPAWHYVEVGDDVLPLEIQFGRLQPVLQFLAQHQRQEAAEQVAADGGVAGVIDRPGFEDGLGGAEDLLHLPQLAVAHGHLEGGELAVGAQHIVAVELCLLGHLGLVEREVVVADHLQELAEAAVADQGFVAARQLLLQRRDDRGPLGGLPGGTFGVVADDIAPGLALAVPGRTRTSLTSMWVVVPAALGIDSGTMPVVSASTLSRTSASLRSRVPRMYWIPRSSSSASVRALIMPRSATTRIRPIAKRPRRRSTTGSGAWTSVALPGQVSEQRGRPWRSMALDDLQVAALTNGFAAEEHAGLV